MASEAVYAGEIAAERGDGARAAVNCRCIGKIDEKMALGNGSDPRRI